MNEERKKELAAVRAVMQAEGIRPRRQKTASSGRFHYSRMDDRGRIRSLGFEWDGAGFDENGRLIIIEAELNGSLNASHIQGHLARLPLMISSGDCVEEIIWVIRPSKKRQLTDIISDWMIFSEPSLRIKMPRMVIESPEGEPIQRM
jgi:hypothetical protein